MEGICGVLPHYKQRVIKGQVLLSLILVQSQDQSDGMSPFKLNVISFSMQEPPGNCVYQKQLDAQVSILLILWFRISE